MKYFVYLFIIFSIGSCNTEKKSKTADTTSNKTSTTSEADNKAQEQRETLTKMGFSKGTIVDNSQLTDCGFMIQLEDKDRTLLWVPGLEEEYKVNGKEVWVKYLPSKMMSKCEKGIPAIIEEIKIPG